MTFARLKIYRAPSISPLHFASFCFIFPHFPTFFPTAFSHRILPHFRHVSRHLKRPPCKIQSRIKLVLSLSADSRPRRELIFPPRSREREAERQRGREAERQRHRETIEAGMQLQSTASCFQLIFQLISVAGAFRSGIPWSVQDLITSQ